VEIPQEEIEADKKGKKVSRDTQEEPKVRMVKPEPTVMWQEQGRVMQFELGREEVFLTEGHT